MKVGITGQAGFMGSHLFNFLGTKSEEIELINFERVFFENDDSLQNFVTSCDVIVHLAAMNRHEDPQVIYNINVGLVNKLTEACKTSNVSPKIIFSSSTQEEKDNLYGNSKKEGRQVLEQWATKNDGQVISLVIPNVFGPFGKPFYNSVVATFCHQVIQGDTPTIHNDGTVNLIYVNELSEVFYSEIISEEKKTEKKIVPHTASIKVSEILALLNSFKSDYVENGVVPNVPKDSFDINLFNTFTSFIPKSYFPRKFTKHEDNRGAFVEIMRAQTSGQSSYSTTVPNITRGNHYHTRKIERFAVISGKASIKWRKVNTEEVFEFILDGKAPAYVDMPIWFTHNITNIGDEELITLFWINEPYDSEDSDTYFEVV
ncbi:MAG: NAD-dependent epimerase/dehydratase family protein [Flavobacteriaceae bacterium]|nr:NAD-dependent epimerase/dehydratase family protein [Flavobacteriaceae bacterium]